MSSTRLQLHFYVKFLHDWCNLCGETCTHHCNNVFFSRLVTALHPKSESTSFDTDVFIRSCRWTDLSFFIL